MGSCPRLKAAATNSSWLQDGLIPGQAPLVCSSSSASTSSAGRKGHWRQMKGFTGCTRQLLPSSRKMQTSLATVRRGPVGEDSTKLRRNSSTDMDRCAAMASTSWGRTWMPPRPAQQSPHRRQWNTGDLSVWSMRCASHLLSNSRGCPVRQPGTQGAPCLPWPRIPPPLRIFQGRLAGGFQDASPQGRIEFYLLALARRGLDGNVYVVAVPAAHQHTGLAGHAGVHRVLAQKAAVDAVIIVGRHAADQVAGVNVFEVHFHFFLQEVFLDPLLEEKSDISRFDVPRRVLNQVLPPEKFLAGAFPYQDQGMLPLPESPFQCYQQAVLPVDIKIRFGNQDEVDLPQGQGGV